MIIFLYDLAQHSLLSVMQQANFNEDHKETIAIKIAVCSGEFISTQSDN